MQGAYSKKNGLPRPYYLQPNTNRGTTQYFTTPMKKLLGYIVVLVLISVLIWSVSRELRPSEAQYQVVIDSSNNQQDVSGVAPLVPRDNESARPEIGSD